MPEKLTAFDEKSGIVRKWIEMNERLPADDIAEMFFRFRKQFVSQQNILFDLLGQLNKKKFYEPEYEGTFLTR